MDEIAARQWLADHFDVSRETMDRLEKFATMLREENCRQNLVSAGSLEHVWSRHIVDSAQLAWLAKDQASLWMDLGSGGGGLPGLILAALDPARHITLVESRKLRWEWLMRAAESLSLEHVTVEAMSVQQVEHRHAGIITARAFAPLPKLFELAHRFSTEETLWLLPKGRSASEELESIADTWHGVFHMEKSVTDPDSAIIVARNVRPKGRRR